MKKYLGSSVSIFAAFLTVFLILGMILFAVIALFPRPTQASVIVSLFCITSSAILLVYAKQVIDDLFSWGTFNDECIQVRLGITKRCVLNYTQCESCGIAFYTHSILNSGAGHKIYYLFISYSPFDEKYRDNINLWHNTSRQIKVQFDKRLFNYLIHRLPHKQAVSLQKDYEKYMRKTGDGSLS